jgi:putative tryptophan/tyrosine transport system substrate-binding protein
MNRRDLIIILVCSAAAAWPPAALAQPSGKVWRVGFIAHRYESFYDALFEGLRQLGYLEGQNIVYERRYAEGRAERFEVFAREMVELKVDVIVVTTTPAAQAAMKATTTIPIVHPAMIDPAALVGSLAHPERNITGGSSLFAELTGKRLELLKEMIPGLSRTAVLWNSANAANASAYGRTQVSARALGVTIQSHAVRNAKDLDVAFATIAKDRVDGLFLIEDQLTFQYRKRIIGFTMQELLPSSFVGKEAVEAGGLMSYGASFPALYRQASTLVHKLLKGAKPSDLPVEEATKFELGINLKTAKALGLEVSPTVLDLADIVIE